MNRLNRLLILIFSLSIVFVLVACSDAKKSKWNLTKEDISKITEAPALEEMLEDGKSKISFEADFSLFNKDLEEDDIFIFDADKVNDLIQSGTYEYLSYEALKKCETKALSIVTSEDKSSFYVTYDDNSGDLFGVLVNKTALIDEFYLMAEPAQGEKGYVDDDYEYDLQKRFEQDIIETQFNYETGGEHVVDLVVGVGLLVGGAIAKKPEIAITGGIDVAKSIIGLACEYDEPTTKELQQRLINLDKKLDSINYNISNSTREIINATTALSIQVDQVLLNQYESAVSKFNTDYVEKLGDFKRDLGDYIVKNLKAYIEEAHNITLYIATQEVEFDNGSSKLKKIAWYNVLNPNKDYEKSTEITINISGFPNALANLAKNKNLSNDSFTIEFMKDIEEGIKDIKLPSGLTKSVLRDLVYDKICEGILGAYFASNTQEASKLKNLVVNYANKIKGANSETPIINRYSDRLKYLYNFGYEYFPVMTSVLSSFKKTLTEYQSLINIGLTYADIDSSEAKTAITDANKYITTFYKSVFAMDNNYSFVLNKVVNGYIGHSEAYCGFSSHGDYAKTNGSNKLELLVVKQRIISKINYDEKKHEFVDQDSLLKMFARYNCLKALGIAKSTDFLNYLADVKVISLGDRQSYRWLQSGMFSEKSKIILTSYIKKSISEYKDYLMYCLEKGGDKGSDYFSVGKFYKLQEKYEKKCWSGEIMTGTFINISDCKVNSRTVVSAYAYYDEEHKYWHDNEHWGFVDGENEYFYCLITNK